MKSDHTYFWIGHSVVGLRAPGSTCGPFANPTQLDTDSMANPSSLSVVAGLGALPAARLTRLVSAKPRQFSMKGDRQARNALSTPGRTTSLVDIGLPFISADAESQ
jgi:hypothetical protein